MAPRVTLIGVLVLLASAPLSARRLDSIQPFYVGAHNACTAWSLAETPKGGVWVTAAHCVSAEAADPEDGPPAALMFRIGPERAELLGVNAEEDLALLRTAHSAAPLKLAHQAPRAGDKITILGTPLGNEGLVYAEGIVSNPAYPLRQNKRLVLWAAIPVCHGHSGAPMLNKRHEVISVFQLMPPDDVCGSYAGGPTWDTLVALLGPLQS